MNFSHWPKLPSTLPPTVAGWLASLVLVLIAAGIFLVARGCGSGA
jgi:hypothetical protein